MTATDFHRRLKRPLLHSRPLRKGGECRLWPFSGMQRYPRMHIPQRPVDVPKAVIPITPRGRVPNASLTARKGNFIGCDRLSGPRGPAPRRICRNAATLAVFPTESWRWVLRLHPQRVGDRHAVAQRNFIRNTKLDDFVRMLRRCGIFGGSPRRGKFDFAQDGSAILIPSKMNIFRPSYCT